VLQITEESVRPVRVVRLARLAPWLPHALYFLFRVRFLRKLARAGAWGEWWAAKHLHRQGYRILATNLRSRVGEVDILAESPDRRTLVVVEVKSSLRNSKPRRQRHATHLTPPELRVNPRKQRKLAALVGKLVHKYQLGHRPVRFDVIGVEFRRDSPSVLRHHVGAFESHL
jgi:putative endonuclease